MLPMLVQDTRLDDLITLMWQSNEIFGSQFFDTKIRITLRKLNQNRKYLNPLVTCPGWFEWGKKLSPQHLWVMERNDDLSECYWYWGRCYSQDQASPLHLTYNWRRSRVYGKVIFNYLYVLMLYFLLWTEFFYPHKLNIRYSYILSQQIFELFLSVFISLKWYKKTDLEQWTVLLIIFVAVIAVAVVRSHRTFWMIWWTVRSPSTFTSSASPQPTSPSKHGLW